MIYIQGDTIKHTKWEKLDGIKNKEVQKAWLEFIKLKDVDLVTKTTVRIFAESVKNNEKKK